MKFRNYLESIIGIGIFPLISLVIFTVFFAFVVIYVWKGNKKHFEELSNLPINEKDKENN